jgi:hypothetical protein
MDTVQAIDKSFEIVENIKPLMAGQPREVQGCVVAQLLSMWVAGHYLNGDALMEQVLQEHIAHVRKLIPVDIDILKKTLS